MKIIICSKCGRLVFKLANGSKAMKEYYLLCKYCKEPKINTNEPPEFFKDIFGGTI